MLWVGHSGGLELRKRASGAMALHGRFPYNKRAVLSDGGRTGRPRKDVIAPRAFAYRVERAEEATALIRTIWQALLYEISAVTRPAYDETQLEACNWVPVTRRTDPALARALQRWRF